MEIRGTPSGRPHIDQTINSCGINQSHCHAHPAPSTSWSGECSNGDTLEAPGYGNARELSQAHQLLNAPPPRCEALLPFHKQVPHKFSGAVQLTGLGPLSDTLVGRVGWDLPAVRREKNVVLGPIEEAEKFIAGWRAQALIAVILAFQDEKRGEQEAFRENSYFV